MKSLFLGSALAQLQQHPVRQEVVDAIKAKTTKWKPREVHENHFRHISVEQMQHTLGSLEEDGKLRTDHKSGILNQLSSLFGLSAESLEPFLQADDGKNPHIPDNVVL